MQRPLCRWQLIDHPLFRHKQRHHKPPTPSRLLTGTVDRVEGLDPVLSIFTPLVLVFIVLSVLVYMDLTFTLRGKISRDEERLYGHRCNRRPEQRLRRASKMNWRRKRDMLESKATIK